LLLLLKDIPTKPHHHPKQAAPAQVDRVREIFLELKVKVGPQRLSRILKRKFKDSADPEVLADSGLMGVNQLLNPCFLNTM